jgi:hypothetical protein
MVFQTRFEAFTLVQIINYSFWFITQHVVFTGRSFEISFSFHKKCFETSANKHYIPDNNPKTRINQGFFFKFPFVKRGETQIVF